MVSHYPDLLFLADEMNIYPNMSKEDQLLFYNLMIPKKKRKTLWYNKKKDPNINIVMEYYGIWEHILTYTSLTLSLLMNNLIDYLSKNK